jgi:hypothetical protein
MIALASARMLDAHRLRSLCTGTPAAAGHRPEFLAAGPKVRARRLQLGQGGNLRRRPKTLRGVLPKKIAAANLD